MDLSSGAKHSAPTEPPDPLSAAREASSAAVRFFQAFAGLFGLELRETGAQALALLSLATAFLTACVIAYLFFLTGLVVLAVGWLGGGWVIVLMSLSSIHAALAAVLWLIVKNRVKRPLFSGTREALRCEMERFL